MPEGADQRVLWVVEECLREVLLVGETQEDARKRPVVLWRKDLVYLWRKSGRCYGKKGYVGCGGGMRGLLVVAEEGSRGFFTWVGSQGDGRGGLS